MLKTVQAILICLLFTGSLTADEKITASGQGIFSGETYKEQIPLNSGGQLFINSASTLSGELKIRSGGENLKVAYYKTLKAPGRAEAAEFATVISVDIESGPDGVTVNLKAPSPAPWSSTDNSGHLNLEITMPDNCTVEINSAYFDVDAAGPFTAFRVTESLSQVLVDKVNGETKIRVSNRPLEVRNITGAVSLINKYNTIRAANINTGDATGEIRNEHGQILIENFRGEIDARTSYDRLVGRGLYLTGDRNYIKNVSASIELQFDSVNSGASRIYNQYGDVEIELLGTVDARFICKNDENGKVRAYELDMVPTLIYDNRLEFQVGEDDAEVRVTTRGDGNITIKGSQR